MLIASLLSAAFVGCQKAEDTTLQQEKETVQTSDAQILFAKALSEAVTDSQPLRTFLKDAALSEFDNDYDVFVPLVKSYPTYGEVDFSNVIDSYLKDGLTLAQVEEEYPFLNILVPDWEWLTGFSARTWDTTEDEVTVAIVRDGQLTVFCDGEELGSLQTGEFPSGPCLVIKDNERMKICGIDTRSGERQYDFVAEEFNGLKKANTKVSSTESDINVTVDSVTNYVKQEELYEGVITAYEKLKDSPTIPQRDYIYFGIDNSTPKGKMDTHIYERLYKIKLNIFSLASDDAKDPHLNKITKKKSPYKVNEILEKIWSDGKFEFHFNIYMGLKSGAISTQELIVTADPDDLFDISKIHKKFYHKTALSKRVYIYTVSAENGLQPKWYAPERTLLLPLWNLANSSTVLTIDAIEYDQSTTVSKTRSISNAFTSNVSISGGETVKASAGLSNTNTTTQSTTVSVSTGSDDLGTTLLHYTYPVISSDQASTSEYKINTITTGAMDMMIIPVRI